SSSGPDFARSEGVPSKASVLTFGVMAVAFARRVTSIVNSCLGTSLEVASLESDDRRLEWCDRVGQLHDFARELRLACALLRQYTSGRGFSPVNDRSPTGKVKRSIHAGQFSQERSPAILAFAVAVQPTAGSVERSR
ncbi:MAG TPA: hypothetical protein VEM34_00550, partial [Burkholderiales bacterium]|nr:hypothetical protein [Burkholderiales bacterium]